MHIGFVLRNFPPLSETFIRREIQGLLEFGHRVTVFACHLAKDPRVSFAPEGLEARRVNFLKSPRDLTTAVRKTDVQHLHSSLELTAHEATWRCAVELGLPFSLMVYGGHSLFTCTDSGFYGHITASRECVALGVEDPFMKDWVVDRLSADPAKAHLQPNSLFLDLYPSRIDFPLDAPPIILSIARFVPKKGLDVLIRGFSAMADTRAELHLIGYGPEEPRLRALAADNPRIRFLGAKTEEETQLAYREASIFALPCIRHHDGDADGIPTVVLEAMASGLPVVVSDLMSASYYVGHGQQGLLTPEGDETAVRDALDWLCEDSARRSKLGRSGRRRVRKLCDIRRNMKRFDELLQAGHARLARSAGRESLRPSRVAPQPALVTIAITTWNRAAWVREAVASALEQTHPRVEVVVVDDGSTDATGRVLAGFGDRIRVRRHDRRGGIAAAKNAALRMASTGSDFVAVLDSDARFHPRMVERCVAFLNDHPELGLVYVDEMLIDGSGRSRGRRGSLHPWDVDRWLETRNLRGDTWLARYHHVMDTRLHEESLSHDVDYDLFYQLLERTRFGHLEEALVFYRVHSRQSGRQELDVARCHAANLVRYGYPIRHAYDRARGRPEWIPAIEEGIEFGKRLLQQDRAAQKEAV